MFGCNALAPYVDRTLVEQHIARLKPTTLLIMGDSPDPSPLNWARDLKQKYPACTVIYRQYNPADQNWDGYSAAQLWDIHRVYAVDGLVVQIWNEPNGYQPLDSLISRAVQICQYARQDGKRVGLPAWGVGHPDDARVDAGELDPLLRELASDTRIDPNLYLVHEYAQASTKDEQPYRIGRFQRTVQRSKAIGAALAYNRIAVTEYGRDYGGNAATDGWKVYFNGDEAAYFQFMQSGVDLYRQLGVLGADVFCCGSTWASFDYQHAETLKADMETWNMQHPVMPVPPIPPTPPLTPLGLYKLTQIPASYVNVRAAPIATAADVGDLHMGDVVQRFTPDVNGWTYVEKDALKGWVSLQNGAVVFTPVTAPAPLFRLKNPVGCAHIISAKFGVPRDYDGDGVFEAIHEGLDITRAHADCTPLILNGHDGIVSDVSATGAYGLHVKVKSTVGVDYTVWFCHMAYIFPDIAPGMAIVAGHPIGIMGTTGNSTGVHLHLNCQKMGAPTPAGSVVPSVIDPLPLIDWN